MAEAVDAMDANGPVVSLAPAGSEILTHTFAVQHSPNCPSPWLVRLPGESGIIDNLPYLSFCRESAEMTGDILGFGKTFDEAAGSALDQFKKARAARMADLKERLEARKGRRPER
jgi:hypothetical protein